MVAPVRTSHSALSCSAETTWIWVGFAIASWSASLSMMSSFLLSASVASTLGSIRAVMGFMRGRCRRRRRAEFRHDDGAAPTSRRRGVLLLLLLRVRPPRGVPVFSPRTPRRGWPGREAAQCRAAARPAPSRRYGSELEMARSTPPTDDGQARRDVALDASMAFVRLEFAGTGRRCRPSSASVRWPRPTGRRWAGSTASASRSTASACWTGCVLGSAATWPWAASASPTTLVAQSSRWCHTRWVGSPDSASRPPEAHNCDLRTHWGSGPRTAR